MLCIEYKTQHFKLVSKNSHPQNPLELANLLQAPMLEDKISTTRKLSWGSHKSLPKLSKYPNTAL